jgi:hypothetical protein
MEARHSANEKRGLAAAFGMTILVELNGIEPMTS